MGNDRMIDSRRPDDALAARKLASASILMAEDSPFMIELIGAMLDAFGVTRIERTGNGEDALAMIEDGAIAFDLVIADWQMAPMDGMGFLTHVRRKFQGRAQRLPIVMCTAHTDLTSVVALRDAGADEVLTKPVSPAAVYEKLTRTLIRPRPFVVSDDYVGPCRRRKQYRIDFTDRRTKNRAVPYGSETVFL